ncbi:MAG: hypothetical protein PV358_15035 [Acidimicrobiales bacterium]|nr:hypothetical protein [Acidimicrobiales bacterium]
MTDPDQRGEELDESVGADFPPDRPPRLDDDGGTEPEVWEEGAADREDIELVGDPDVGAIDDEAELVGLAVERGRDTGALDPDDEFTGDETTRDFQPERVARPAEEQALHIEEE